MPAAACVVSLVDRLMHRAEVVRIEGDSYRQKEAEEREASAKKEREAAAAALAKEREEAAKLAREAKEKRKPASIFGTPRPAPSGG